MTWRNYLLLFLLGLVLTSGLAIFQAVPGYMDAEYYYAGGVRLASGFGFSEEILWNYLDDPGGLPHPSHGYWAPLASLVAAIGMALFNSTGFWAARAGFLLVGSLAAPLTATLAYSISARKDHALLAGTLAAIPCFYLSYLGTTDTFGILMVLGGVWFILLGKITTPGAQPKWNTAAPLLLGLICGLFHLARADGMLWLGVAGLAVLFSNGQYGEIERRDTRRVWLRWISCVLMLLFGYLLVMGPWMKRNLQEFGSLLSPGGLRLVWQIDYNDLYAYPAELLTPARWWSSGFEAILSARTQALSQNLQTALAVQGEIFLAPLVLGGLWYWRGDPRLRWGMLGWCLTLFVMTVVFPYAGWRGGFFHSGAAYQPLFWAVAPAGLERFIAWGRRVRNWDVRQAGTVFRVGLVGLAFMLSLLVVQRRVIGSSFSAPVWGQSWAETERVEQAIAAAGVPSSAIVMVNNAPGYYAANQRPAISIPNGGVETLLQVARRYQAGYVIVDRNHPPGIRDLYDQPSNRSGLDFLFTFEEKHIYAIEIP